MNALVICLLLNNDSLNDENVRQELILRILDDFVRDAMVLDVKETSVNRSLLDPSSKALAILKVFRVEWSEVDHWDLLWSAIARWHIQDIAEDWTVSGAQLELSRGWLGLSHVDLGYSTIQTLKMMLEE